jgi:hypothetical protein
MQNDEVRTTAVVWGKTGEPQIVATAGERSDKQTQHHWQVNANVLQSTMT